MAIHTRRAMIYLLGAYALVTGLGFLLTVLFMVVLDFPPDPVGTPAYAVAPYRATEPFHPLLNLAVFPFFAWGYWRGRPVGSATAREAWGLGAVWCLVTMGVDLIGWVLIPHPWQMPARQFYLDYQPWITLVYAVILLSPVGVQRWLRRRTPLTPRSSPAQGKSHEESTRA